MTAPLPPQSRGGTTGLPPTPPVGELPPEPPAPVPPDGPPPMPAPAVPVPPTAVVPPAPAPPAPVPPTPMPEAAELPPVAAPPLLIPPDPGVVSFSGGVDEQAKMLEAASVTPTNDRERPRKPRRSAAITSGEACRGRRVSTVLLSSHQTGNSQCERLRVLTKRELREVGR